MKRRTWFRALAAIGVAAICPWLKQAKAADGRDQTIRINKLRARLAFGWINRSDEITSCRLLAIDRGVAVQLYCDADRADSDGKYATAAVAIRKRVAQTMDDETLCRKLGEGLLRSMSEGHRTGLFAVGEPSPEWIKA